MLAAALASSTMAGVWSSPASASSHREAPAISQDPTADNTDVYTFRDVADPSKVNILADFIGLEDPNGGPNFARFGDDVQYSIHIDNNGDVADDITFNFRFRTTFRDPSSFLYNDGRITEPNDYNLIQRQTYSVERITNGGPPESFGTALPVPPVNVGVRSVGTGSPANQAAAFAENRTVYERDIAQPTVNTNGGVKMFAGTREDPFFADTGSIFDLGALRPIQNNHLIPLPATGGVDILAGKNVHTIAMQLPIASITSGNITPTVVDSKTSVIGVRASTSRQRAESVTRLGLTSSTGLTPITTDRWVQVSRLAIPLVNEVLIPTDMKDRFNRTLPKNDGANGFFNFILDPEFTKLLPVLYPTVFNAGNIPGGGAANRPDLVKLVTGQLAGLSPANALPPADLLRINLASPAGVTAFPNGRRLADDVVDTEIQVLAGALLDADGIINGTAVPYSALKDGVNATDGVLLNTFPYAGTPFNGFTARSCNTPDIACPGPGAP